MKNKDDQVKSTPQTARLTPVPSKRMEMIIRDAVKQHMNTNNLLHQHNMALSKRKSVLPNY